jgi:hypothetical protein
MHKKQSLGQFYTTHSKYIIHNLIDHLPFNLNIIDPFAGNKDLLNLFSDNCNKLAYDIDPKLPNIIKQDTLLNPPNYKDHLIITNPPYLARNKSKNKEIYDKYQVNDLYKAFIKTITLDVCKGGIIILPLNFFCDEDNEIRKTFFNHYSITKLKIFEEQVFDDTSYTICAFSFINNNTPKDTYSINTTILPKNENITFLISKNNGFRIGGEFYDLINSVKSNVKISRLLKNSKQIPNTNIKLRSVDTGSNEGRISLSIDEHYYGLNTDRVFATIILSETFNLKQQEFIANEFNSFLEEQRNLHNSLFLTNFRNSTKSYARKRISFETAYKIIQYIIEINRNSLL